MPVGEGVRVCTCGCLFLSRDCELVEVLESSEFPRPDWAGLDEFRKNISKPLAPDLMLAVRLDLWRDLNHPYRETYRRHRDKEEADIKAAWLEANPDRRRWWDKLRGKPAPRYVRPSGHPMTFPDFEASAEQLANMSALTELLLEREKDGSAGLLLVELYRQQAQFEQARQVLALVKTDYDKTLQKVIGNAIAERLPMPLRFMR